MRGSSSLLAPFTVALAASVALSGCGVAHTDKERPESSEADRSEDGNPDLVGGDDTGAGGTGPVVDGGAAGGETGGPGGDAGEDAGGAGGDAGSGPGGAPGTGGSGTGPVESRCTVTPEHAECPFESVDFGSQGRQVVYQTPNGAPPATGWPVVLLLHGSLFGAETSFSGDEGEAFSPYNGAMNVKSLLDAGFAIIAPQGAGLAGSWDTNFPPYSTAWTLSKDHALMLELFDAVDAGEFGPMDASRWYAMGISSGGYMTSRVAIEYPGRFVAIAINSGSYMTCTNLLCFVPAQDSGHPPTLFLHGQNDPAVPVGTMKSYDSKLTAAGVETKVIIDPAVFHAWLAEGQVEIPQWFDTHR
jgi:poly(3-hydroxyoctanoate) depolymerase